MAPVEVKCNGRDKDRRKERFQKRVIQKGYLWITILQSMKKTTCTSLASVSCFPCAALASITWLWMNVQKSGTDVVFNWEKVLFWYFKDCCHTSCEKRSNLRYIKHRCGNDFLPVLNLFGLDSFCDQSRLTPYRPCHGFGRIWSLITQPNNSSYTLESWRMR